MSCGPAGEAGWPRSRSCAQRAAWTSGRSAQEEHRFGDDRPHGGERLASPAASRRSARGADPAGAGVRRSGRYRPGSLAAGLARAQQLAHLVSAADGEVEPDPRRRSRSGRAGPGTGASPVSSPEVRLDRLADDRRLRPAARLGTPGHRAPRLLADPNAQDATHSSLHPVYDTLSHRGVASIPRRRAATSLRRRHRRCCFRRLLHRYCCRPSCLGRRRSRDPGRERAGRQPPRSPWRRLRQNAAAASAPASRRAARRAATGRGRRRGRARPGGRGRVDRPTCPPWALNQARASLSRPNAST